MGGGAAEADINRKILTLLGGAVGDLKHQNTKGDTRRLVIGEGGMMRADGKTGQVERLTGQEVQLADGNRF